MWASLVTQLVKNPPAMKKTWVDPWAGKIPWRSKCVCVCAHVCVCIIFQILFHYRLLYDIVYSSLWGWGGESKLGVWD